MKPVFAHIKSDASYFNAGDEASCPQQYFPEFADCKVGCLNDVAGLPAGQPVILGGGGILAYPEFVARTAKQRPTIIFGAGLNNRLPFNPQPVVEALRLCALVGIRDRKFAGDFGFEYAPCASTANPFFGHIKGALRYNVFTYQHAWESEIPHLGGLVLTNMDRNAGPDDIIDHMCHSRVVVTNSYHGALWAQLAGRRCIVWRPSGIRFYSGLPATPVFVNTALELKAALDFSPEPPKVYQDCLRITQQFRNAVNEYLDNL